MGVMEWAATRAKRLSLWDIGVLKVYCVLFGMILGAYLSTYVREHVLWFIGAVLVLGGGFGFRWVTSKPS